MVTKSAKKASPTLKRPEKLDLKKGRKIAEKVVRDNVDWLKEMAKK